MMRGAAIARGSREPGIFGAFAFPFLLALPLRGYRFRAFCRDVRLVLQRILFGTAGRSHHDAAKLSQVYPACTRAGPAPEAPCSRRELSWSTLLPIPYLDPIPSK